MSHNDLLTTEQVAQRLGKSVSQVNRLAKAGHIAVEIQLPGTTGARLFHPDVVHQFTQTPAPEAAAPGGFGGGSEREGTPRPAVPSRDGGES